MSLSKFFFKFYPLFILLVIGLVLFWPTFHLSIFGDEWQALWYVRSSLALANRFNIYNGYGPYAVAAVVVNFVSQIFNDSSRAVYVLSFISRYLAAVSIYFFFKSHLK